MKWRRQEKRERWMSRGLTLLEVMIVLAILAIVVGIAYPSFQRIAINTNLKTAARDLASDFASLKERAIAEYRMQRITINVPQNSYTIQTCDNQGSSCNGWNDVWRPAQTKNLADIASDIVLVNSTIPAFNFQTRGTVSPGTVELTNSRASTAQVVTNITGRARVEYPVWQ